MGWKGESRRHSLSRKGIKTNLPDGRRFDVSNFVSRGKPLTKTFNSHVRTVTGLGVELDDLGIVKNKLIFHKTPKNLISTFGQYYIEWVAYDNNGDEIASNYMEIWTDGMKVKEAVIESGRVRIKPILLTAITSIVALLPVAISGDALFTPLAVTIISGILFSTLLTLIIVPMLYIVFLKFRRRGKELKKSGQY